MKEYVKSQESQYTGDDVNKTVIDDMAAPGTKATQKRIKELWLTFLEEKGYQRKWDSKGPTIGMYIDIEYFIETL